MGYHSTQHPSVARLAIAVTGVVQGVGFRPFVYNAARNFGLSGWVANEADTVRIEVQGNRHALDAFLDTLQNGHPPQASIDSIRVDETQPRDDQPAAFDIRPAAAGAAPRPTMPADLATCADCLSEIRDAGQRRYGYPFTNCTNCGPRWSIIEALPYDRPRTSMAGFEMCADCRAEYENPADRRFHAQPIACPHCGPALRLLDRQGRQTHAESEALQAAADAILAGKVVALKGLGGFQLLVDATNAEAVALLRKRKQRPDKPLAVMVGSLEEARQWCHVSDDEARALSSHEAPILLLRRRDLPPSSPPSTRSHALPSTRSHAPHGNAEDAPYPAATVAPADTVAPGNPYLGVMLPYTPLHHLLMDAIGRPIVCTSGNLSEEPMAITTADALKRLGIIADVFLTHNRPIVRPVDDSVARIGPQGFQLFRRARGFAPLPINLPDDDSAGSSGDSPAVLAVGGHLKNAVALCLGLHPAQVIVSPHVGNLDNLLSVESHRRAIEDLVGFFRAEPQAVACDLHPDYASTRCAETLADRWDVPLVRVQHHHAHVASCMAEHGLKGRVLGFSWDGTGYGSDGTVWGGEALLCEGAEFLRMGHLRTFALPGGDKAVRQPRRSTLGLLFEMLGTEAVTGGLSRFSRRENGTVPFPERYLEDAFTAPELKTLISMLSREVRSPRTSSMGRLFDAVAALCGLPAVISFEGQAAMALEFSADESETGVYPMPVSQGTGMVADWEPLVRAVLADREAGVPIGRISGRFHNALAEMALTMARSAKCRQIVLSGGCFQNALLSERLLARLSDEGFSVYTQQKVPPGDGGIALGQAFVAARQLAELPKP